MSVHMLIFNALTLYLPVLCATFRLLNVSLLIEACGDLVTGIKHEDVYCGEVQYSVHESTNDKLVQAENAFQYTKF
jgi:hypothetical protein